ncbi:FABP6 protein, partial [Tyrannus savana]|nr:FABP6 protein [Tyrannus savana]
PKGNMAFAGKYEFEGDENYDEFVKKIGKSGLGSSGVQVFTEYLIIEIPAIPGTLTLSLLQATVKMEDGKLVADFPNYRHTAEICGGKLVEISTSSGVVYKRTSKKIA